MAGHKKAIPQATRRAVALRSGATPGETSVAACSNCGTEGRIYWPRLSSGKPGSWVKFPGLELDHITPESKGGDATPDNITLLCVTCNRRKGHRL